MSELMNYLKSRRSAAPRRMDTEDLDRATVSELISIAIRSPDHGMLSPWRFIVIQGEARAEFGELLAKRKLELDAQATDKMQETERGRFQRAQAVIFLISSPQHGNKIPVWEQELSCGAVGMNLLHAASALGLGSNWLTGWAAFDEKVIERLDLSSTERVAGIFYVGKCDDPMPDRNRPNVSELVKWL